jgi:MSHA biogenesis protein MshE
VARTAAQGESNRSGRPASVRLGDLLLQNKLLSQEKLRVALEEQRRSGRKLGRVLVDSGYLTEEEVGEALGMQLGVPFINLKYYNITPSVTRKLPEAQARRFRALALEESDDSFLVAMSDPTDLFAHDELSRILKREVRIAVVADTPLTQAIDRTYRRTDQITDLARELGDDIGEAVDFGALGAGLGAEEAPVVRLLQSVFEDAIQVKASDIHIEPQEKNLQIRFRIDGVLHIQNQSDPKIAPPMVQRLKLSSGLDISEKRLPQDGRFNMRVRDQQVDVRISTMPTQFGESVVMRLLRRSGGTAHLAELGLPPGMLDRFRVSIEKPNGMILVTGPTGSGKTTTLYAALQEINTPERKIITVEDPVEYRLPGLNQVQVNEKVELTFSRVLRSVLRQDPDVILVGEIRDMETAQIAMRAAITGHMVLSTLHTRDAASAPLRLVDMGVPNYMAAYAMQCVIAQRLIRLNCNSCGEPHEPESREADWLSDVLGDHGISSVVSGRGCQRCNNTGFSGRTGLYELLEIDAELAALIGEGNPGKYVSAANEKMRGKSLRDEAARLVVAGRTTVAEAMRIAAQFED